MPIRIDGTTGISGVDGTAAAPAVQGNDTNTGIFFPANDTIAFAEGGTEVMRIDANGNVGIGTSTPLSSFPVNLTLFNANGSQSSVTSTNIRGDFYSSETNQEVGLRVFSNHPLTFRTNNTERMRIDNSGGVYIGKTTTALSVAGWYFTSGIGSSYAFTMGGATNEAINFNNFGTGTYDIAFRYQGTTLGYIRTTSTTVSYVNLSDYRLKENIKSMTGALSKVMQLNPVTYTWKSDGSDGQGFIAHELQSIVPDCVTGEKDAVDIDGNPVYQGIDPSKLVATLTAAIQELSSKLDEANARIEALESRLNAN